MDHGNFGEYIHQLLMYSMHLMHVIRVMDWWMKGNSMECLHLRGICHHYYHLQNFSYNHSFNYANFNFHSFRTVIQFSINLILIASNSVRLIREFIR